MRREGVSLWRISAQGSPGIITTTEHPFYAREQGRLWRNVDRNYDRVFSDPGWRPAKELGGLFAAQVLPDEVRSDLSLDFWWLVGRYLADGWRVKRKGRKNGRVVICCASHEAGELAARIARAGFTASRCAERTVVKFHITKGSFYEFLQPFGAYAHGKTLPGFVYELPAEPARSLLDGYLSGDGYQDSGFKAATTVSKRLALGVALLAQRAYGVVASVTTNGKPATCVIEGRTVNQRPCHIVVIPDRNRSAFVDGKYGWKLVRKSGPVGLTGTVHNISVDGDESYVAEGCVVHNCQPFSVAGKQLGSADERNMWPATAAVLRDVRPSFAFLENVPGLLSNPYWKTIRGNLAALGYDATWGVLGAADVGAPHRRKRLWVFCWLRDLPDAERDRVRVIAERYQRSERGEPAAERGNAEPGDDGAAG